MQSTYEDYSFINHPMDQPLISNCCGDRDSWFPTNPNCPNHKVGVPFSRAFGHPNANGDVSCIDCFMHSTIIQSMSTSCQHLHACSNCANCYSQNNYSPPTISQAISPPLMISGRSPLTLQTSPSPFPTTSPHALNYTSHNYDADETILISTPPLQACHYPMVTARKEHPLLLQHDTTQQANVSHQLVSPYAATYRMPYLMPGQAQITSNQQTNQVYTPYERQQRDEVPSRSNSPAVTSPAVTNLEAATKGSGTDENITPTKKSKNVTGVNKIDSNHNKKRGVNDVCEVCGDRASGYHYNALTCEGCKGFFRRSINRKDPPYKCKFGGTCEMDTYTRRKCPECRLRKCKAVGMLEECLLTEIQCQSKRRRRKTTKTPDTDTQDFCNDPSPSASPSTRSSLVSTPENKSCESQQAMSAEEERMICDVGTAFGKYRANPEIVKRWESYLENSSQTPKLCDIATAHVQVLVEFTKQLPGFSRLDSEDQIALLKGSVVELMLLRNACGYNLRKDAIDISMVAKDTGVQENKFRGILDFFAGVARLNLDEKEFGILAAIILFDSDHPHTQDKARIERYRETYLSALALYSARKEPRRRQIVARILNLITELRTLYDTYTKLVSKMKEKEQLSPLLCEIWDLG